MRINIDNRSSLDHDEVGDLLAPLQLQLTEFCAAWSLAVPDITLNSHRDDVVTVVVADEPDSDTQHVLGCHHVSEGGRPYGNVFIRPNADQALAWSVTLSHEILELTADPYCVATVQIGPSTFAALEVCDPVEADSVAQCVGAARLSNWVYPAWFNRHASAPFDRVGVLRQPLQLVPGGYFSYWTPSSGWTTARAQSSSGVRSRADFARPRS